MSEDAASTVAQFEHDPSLNLYQRLLLVMKDVAYVQKQGKADSSVGGYKFVKHDDVVAAIRPALVKHGVLALPWPDPAGHEWHQGEATKSGKVPIFTVLPVGMLLINVDKPEEVCQVPAFPAYGIDTQDKGPGKAFSYAVKYLWLKLLNLETGDDPETDAVDAGHVSRSAPPSQSPPQDTQPPVAKAMWAALKANHIDDAAFRAWLKRNMGRETTGSFTGEDYQKVITWAKKLPEFKRKLWNEAKASGMDAGEVVNEVTAIVGVPMDQMTVEEWQDLLDAFTKKADESVPFTGDKDEEQVPFGSEG